MLYRIHSALNDLVSTENGIQKALIWMAIIAVTTMVTLFAIAWLPDVIPMAGRTEFGAFGDFVGGLLNPALTFITFIALIFTIVLQQKELRLARDEFKRTASALEKENFESTFFRLCDLLRENVNSIDIESGRRTYTGPDAFKFVADTMRSRLKSPQVYSDTTSVFKEIENEHGYEFSSYLRLSYNIFLWLKDAQDQEPSRDISLYIRIFRSQFTDYELVYLAYNSLTKTGEQYGNLLARFSILSKLRQEYLPNSNDISLF